jgi:hypothetical protein
VVDFWGVLAQVQQADYLQVPLAEVHCSCGRVHDPEKFLATVINLSLPPRPPTATLPFSFGFDHLRRRVTLRSIEKTQEFLFAVVEPILLLLGMDGCDG